MRDIGAVQTFLIPFKNVMPYLAIAIEKHCTTPFQIDDEETIKMMLNVCQKEVRHRRDQVGRDVGNALLRFARQYSVRKEEERSSSANGLIGHTQNSSTSSSPPSTTSLPAAGRMQTRSRRAAITRTLQASNSPPVTDTAPATTVCSQEEQSDSDFTLSALSHTPSLPSDYEIANRVQI